MQRPSSKINYDALKKLSDEEDVSFILLPCFTVNLSFLCDSHIVSYLHLSSSSVLPCELLNASGFCIIDLIFDSSKNLG